MLTLCANFKLVPMGLLPVPQIAEFIGVHQAQVVDWCKDGTLKAERHNGKYWVRVDALTSFIERSRWAFVAAPGGRVVDRYSVALPLPLPVDDGADRE